MGMGAKSKHHYYFPLPLVDLPKMYVYVCVAPKKEKKIVLKLFTPTLFFSLLLTFSFFLIDLFLPYLRLCRKFSPLVHPVLRRAPPDQVSLLLRVTPLPEPSFLQIAFSNF